MAVFQIFNAAGAGFNMSNTGANGWAFVTSDPSAETYVLGDNGSTAGFAIDTSGRDFIFEVDYQTPDGFNYVLQNLRFYDYTTGAGLMNVQGVNIITTADDLAAPAAYVRVNGGHDVWIGNKYTDIIKAGAGDDDVYGNSGNDQLYGESGVDILVGGLGRDTLSGGSYTDVFDFNSVTESRVGSTRDTITDFKSKVDVVDLRTIDANVRKAGNQAFTWIDDDRFHGKAGELRYDNGILSGDRNGDKRADFEIKVKVHDLVVTKYFETSDIWL